TTAPTVPSPIDDPSELSVPPLLSLAGIRQVGRGVASLEPRRLLRDADVRRPDVQVSRQLGHARPSITSDVYARLFDQARHADDIRQRMAESAFGRVLVGNGLET